MENEFLNDLEGTPFKSKRSTNWIGVYFVGSFVCVIYTFISLLIKLIHIL